MPKFPYQFSRLHILAKYRFDKQLMVVMLFVLQTYKQQTDLQLTVCKIVFLL